MKSMTGFGRATIEFEKYLISFEIKSVNHRYFDFSCRYPRQYGFVEDKIKSYVNSKVSRGKIDCYLSIESLNTDDIEIDINNSLVSAYIDAFNKISNQYSIDNNVSSYDISKIPEALIVKKKEIDEDELWGFIKEVIDKAIDQFINMREVEGLKMKEDILNRSNYILDCVDYIEKRSPETIKEYNDKLINRIHEVIGDVTLDENRILQEVAIYTDKIAVAEETVRLRSHISQLHSFLDVKEPIGRKMDFLVQEINREANTIGSKASDVDIARKVVDIKAEVEKIREQIQNIE